MVLGLALVAAAALGSLAILSDSAIVPDGVLATADCFRARVGAVHSGEVTSTGPGTTQATIPAVATGRSFVVHSTEAAGSDVDAGSVAVRLTNDTTVEVVRQGSATDALTVRFHVVEYACGIRVQRGTSTASTDAARDVPIEVTDAARAFTTVSVAPGAAAATPTSAQQVTAALAAPDTLRLEAGAAPASDARWHWQVVEYLRPADAVAQHATATLSSGDATATVTLPTAVDPSRTIVLAGTRSTAGDLEQVAVTAELSAADQVTLQRGTTGAEATVEVQVIELFDGTFVQAGALTVADTATTATATLDTVVDTTRATPLGTGTAWGGGAAAGRTDAGADAIGRPLGRFTLDDEQTVRVTRGRSDGTTTWPYQVVVWGGPAWWDLTWGYRERLEVSTTTTASPDGYTVPLTFDHAAMVAAGRALASGDDVRVLRHDGSGWTELDRVLDDTSSWGAADTRIWFRTAAPIATDTTDASYWLHHGNAAAGAPPADPAQVFLATEDFESGLGAFSDRSTGTGWYAADDWSYRRTITVPAGTAASDLSDVPVLVATTQPDMLGQVQDDGSDLRFTAADGTTALPHEVERWDPTTGQLLAWVEIPNITAAADTTVLLHWGASDAPDQQSVRATWTNGFDGVWHLDQDPTGDLPHAEDSSPEGRRAVQLGGATTTRTNGVIGDGASFAADTARLVAGTTVATDAPLTLSGWVTPGSATSGTVLRLDGPTGEHAGVSVAADGLGNLQVRASLRDASGTLHTTQGGTLAVGDAGHVAATWDGAVLRAWLNGVPVGSVAVGSRQVAADVEVTLGAAADGTAPLDGTLDEVRLDAVARSGSWLALQTAMRLGLVTVGAPQAGSFLPGGTWTARLPLTVDAGTVDAAGTGETLTDFPLLVSVTDPALTAANADGSDLVVTAEDGSTRLDHELESFDPSTGAVVLWVRVPVLDPELDTGLFLYHGNAAASDQQDPAGVWRDGFTSVHHLADDPEATP